jgi:large subunit ribosomal protein L17
MHNQVRSLLLHEQIRTTEAKAKELRKLADRLISIGLEDTVHARRKAYRVLGDHGLVKRLFDELAPRYDSAQGGYTRVVKLAQPRSGDAAPMALVAFVEPQKKDEAA